MERAYRLMLSHKHSIECLLYSSDTWVVPRSVETVGYAYKGAQFLEAVLSSNKFNRVNADMNRRIGEALCTYVDVLGIQLENQLSVDQPDPTQDVWSFTETVMMLKKYINELDIPFPEEEEDDDDAVSSRIGYGGKMSKMVGLSDEYTKLKEQLMSSHMRKIQAFPIVGMAGIGKTTLAKRVFEDPDIVEHFEYRVWVTVGRKYRSGEIARSILAQVNPDYTDKLLLTKEYEIGQNSKERLNSKRRLIVLDDVWDTHVLSFLRSFLPYHNGIAILLTTRRHKVAQDGNYFNSGVFEMHLLNKEESWDLLCKKVFTKELCPAQFEKAGKKIAENCDGLPLTIITVADLLSKAEKTPEYWREVATNKEHQLFVDAYDEISKVIYPSFEYLIDDLKVNFLYMGVFPQNYKITKSKLMKMWTAEGLLEPYISQTSTEDYIVKCLHELSFENLVMLNPENTIWHLISTSGIKTCRLHSSTWHFCKREARKKKFFYILNNDADGLADQLKSQPRLCIHNNILLGIKDVYNSIEDNCASTAHSLLCFGSYNQYPVPMCFGLRLLRILDALTIYFYKFPIQVLELIQLRYLAFTCNGKLPTSISKLRNLQFLIVRRHLSINSCGTPSYLPMEIWDMKELKHLQIMGSDLPHVCDALLPNLLTLLDVSARSCTKDVFGRIPNLKKLGIRIELVPNGDKPLCCFDNISHLNKLESFKCVIVNPAFGSELVSAPAPLSMFSTSLKKLSLSGFGYPWEYMSVIASLPNLQVLKLRSYAFRGPKWETKENGFLRLKVLVIEDTDLVQWKLGRGSFKLLACLSIKHCYKLKELNLDFGIFLSKIELVDCNPLAVIYVEQTKKAELRKGYPVPDVYVHSSV